jgi:uncharacterized protein with HEPN domain
LPRKDVAPIDEVWAVVERDLPTFREQIQTILRAAEE